MSQDAHARIGEILDDLSGSASPAVVGQVQDLLRHVLALHRDGLALLVDHVDRGVLVNLADDPAVDGLLVLHDLHPLDLATRAAHVATRLREEEPGVPVHLAGVEASGTVHVRLSASGPAAAQLALEIEERVLAALPDAAGVVVETVAPPAVVPLSRTRLKDA